MPLLKSNYVHELSLCHADVIINSCYYQLLASSLANYGKYLVKVYSSPITSNTNTAIVHLPIQIGTNKYKFIRLDSVIIVLKEANLQSNCTPVFILYLCPECHLTIPSAIYFKKPNKDKLRL